MINKFFIDLVGIKIFIYKKYVNLLTITLFYPFSCQKPLFILKNLKAGINYKYKNENKQLNIIYK